jgi:ribonuclease BN (tRNA processing enzyme)
MGSPLIQFLGTGNAFNTDGRGTQSILFAPGAASPFLVDIGPTAFQAMVRFGVDWAKIDRLFLTHLHGDHTAGWPFLLLNMVIQERRTRPFDIFGPQGTQSSLDGLAAFCFHDVLARQSFDIRYHELPVAHQEGVDGQQGMQFDVLPMEHHASSIGYRFHVDGTRIGVTGDTGWCESLELLGATCKVLIAECSSVSPDAPAHLSLEEIRKARPSLGAGQLLLVHLTDGVAEELARDPVPDLLATYDGMIFLP